MRHLLTSLFLTLSLSLYAGCDKSDGGTTSPDDAEVAQTDTQAESHEGAEHHEAGEGHEHHEGAEHDHGDVEGKPVVVAGEAAVGDVTNCPVSGETFVVTAESPNLEYEGKTYYFCCANCHAKASADPAKFLAVAAE